MSSQWDSFARGLAGPLDAPRPASNEHWDYIATMTVSSLYLSKNQTYRGQGQLIFDPRHVARLDELTADEWTRLAGDHYLAEQTIVRVLRPDHINVESLGNVVPHLHWHIIPRYLDDPSWGAPIWRVPLASMADTRLPDEERESLIASLRSAIAG